MSAKSHPPVAIPADYFSHDPYMWHGTPDQYILAAIEVGHLTPMIIPAAGNHIDIDAILDTVSGVLISGAKSNVEPKLYGMEATPQHLPFDPARDATSLPLIRAAIARKIPLLAICRGIQELNVALGGTLFAAVHAEPDRDDHRAPANVPADEKFALRQHVSITKNACLAAILGTEDIIVNSVHGQAIDILSPHLVIEATAADGTIEAVSMKDAQNFVLGLQWHPEYWAKTDAPSRKIFEAFGDAVRKFHAQR